MIDIACVHGINTSPVEALAFANHVQSVFTGHYLCSEVNCVPVRWGSSGTISQDILSLIYSKEIPEWVFQVRVGLGQVKPAFVVAHSLGVPLTVAAKTNLPIIGMGSPLGHSWYSKMLAMRFKKQTVTRLQFAYDFWNDDDPVSSAQLWPIKRTNDLTKLGWSSTRVAYPGHLSFKEHSDEIYLESPVVRDTILTRATAAVVAAYGEKNAFKDEQRQAQDIQGNQGPSQDSS
jgi:hypothetical protein